jgi:hypothetical protein
MATISNAQQGTRGMSASDWIRIKRLQGARANGYNYTANGVSVSGVLSTNKDIAPPNAPQISVHNNSAINVFDAVGTSRIRRPASNWTDYVASQTADYILSSQKSTTGTAIKNSVTKLCGCTTATLATKTGICTSCSGTRTHVRIM